MCLDITTEMCRICNNEYKGVTQIVCCPSVTMIPEIPGLQELTCSNCPNITTIPVIPGLQELTCSNCPNLTTIPVIPGLQELWCYNCPYLQLFQ
jgi:hypothetical protein